MKIIFISFQDNSDIIGVKYLHAHLVSKSHQSSILFIPDNRADNLNKARDYIISAKPDLLCCSAMSYEFRRAGDFLRVLRPKLNGGCRVIFGGIHATAEFEECLEYSDIVVRGEGEETLVELAGILEAGRQEDIAQVRGIVFKDKSGFNSTPIRQPVENLDGLAFPGHLPDEMYVVDRGKIHPIQEPRMYKKYARYQGTFLSISSSRGCPFSCRYCSNSMLKSLYGKGGVRNRSVGSVIDEIRDEISNCEDILYVNFVDDCFMMHSPEWIADFSKRYKKEVGLPFVARSTPKHTDREKISLLRDAGLRWVFMGLQTGSDRINREIYGRHATSGEFLKSAEIISEFRISPWYDVILDNPYEKEEDHLQTIDVLLRTPRPFQLGLFSLDYFPGTELLRRVKEDKIPIPELGAKSYTKPEPLMINRYIRMSATLPRGIVRLLVPMRNNAAGRALGLFFYGVTLSLEPFMYFWLTYNSNDFRLLRTIKVARAFYLRSINKLFLRKIA